jgi:hypothetical protein
VAASAGILFVIGAVMFVVGGFRNLDIILNEGRTTATVFGIGSHGVLKYRYDVDGHTYAGGGDPGNPPYPQGSSYEVHYSTVHPFFSTAQNPVTLFGQMLVGCLFVGGGLYSMSLADSKRRAKNFTPP